ncbi:MAG: cytidine deaminase [Clostridiales bacterium]|nr:cytidine deaminase [Clostridiales bacterium]
MMDYKELIKEAFDAQKNSYSPYSSCKVGAALLCEDGRIYKGCNIENASFSLTNCAERTALFKAVSEGERGFEVIAVVGNNGQDELFFPCGACRQALSEFCGKDFKIIVAKCVDEYKVLTLGELLPFSFDKEVVYEKDC